MIKRSTLQPTTFDYVPIGDTFLLGSPNSRRPLRVFKKISDKFAICEEYENNAYYFIPQERVHIECPDQISPEELKLRKN